MTGSRIEIYFAISFVFVVTFNASQGNLEGHLEPLFSHGKRLEVEVYDGFPTAEEFFRRFVDVEKPVLLRGAARLFPAFSLWNDEYFLSYTESEELLVTVEVDKKENRSAPGEDLSFADFVRDMHSSGKYMISSVPEFLRKDILLPFPIACHDITQGNLVHEILWFSSGGTKSVLHNDHAENIMCVFKGTKEFFLIDREYQEQVNVTERGYSEVDVDRVDLFKYPGLHKIEHHFAFIEPGDCLYVPFLWVHYVRSYDLNMAVNIWWRHGVKVNFRNCDTELGTTIEDLTFIGFGALHDAQEKLIRNRLFEAVKLRGDNISLKGLQGFFTQPDVLGYDVHWSEEMYNVLQKLFSVLDRTQDDKITSDDLSHLHQEDWEHVRVLVTDLTDLSMAENDMRDEEMISEAEQFGEAIEDESDLHTEL